MSLLTIPPSLLDELDADAQQRVQSDDPETAARAVLAIVDEFPPFSSLVRERSQWLALARQIIVKHVDPDLRLDVPLLSAIAQTAFAARETTPALTASEQALAAAIDLRDLPLEASIRARRLPHLSLLGLRDATTDMERLEQLERELGAQLSAGIRVEIGLGRVAWTAAQGDFDGQRRALAGLARLPLPQDERLTFVAYATQCSLAQLSLRSRERLAAVKALMEAARLAAEMQAHAELANLQAILAAFAVRTGDFDSALAHAESSLSAAQQMTSGSGQPDPWLGLPVDVSTESECSGAIRVLAEAAVTALDRTDRIGFLVLVTSLVAFYLLDDRAPEALDALTESIETAEQFDEPRGAAMLRSVSESLLRRLGMLS